MERSLIFSLLATYFYDFAFLNVITVAGHDRPGDCRSSASEG
jgi:hypothetical protein